MAVATVERKYQLIKVKAGDWLLPSNDGQTLWRIRQYEDGPSHGIDAWSRDRTVWGVWRWTGRGDFENGLDEDEFDEWANWECWDSSLATRTEAIDTALTNKT